MKNWPNLLNYPKISKVSEEERQALDKSENTSLSTQHGPADQPRPSVNTMIPCKNYSSLTKLLRVTALLYRVYEHENGVLR